jgi:hypothetical protein
VEDGLEEAEATLSNGSFGSHTSALLMAAFTVGALDHLMPQRTLLNYNQVATYSGTTMIAVTTMEAVAHTHQGNNNHDETDHDSGGGGGDETTILHGGRSSRQEARVPTVKTVHEMLLLRLRKWVQGVSATAAASTRARRCSASTAR